MSDFCRIEHTTRKGNTEINYVPAIDGQEEEKRLRSLGSIIHHVSYGTYGEVRN